MITTHGTIGGKICDQKHVSSKQWPYNVDKYFYLKVVRKRPLHQTQWHLWTSHYSLWNYCTIYSSVHTHSVYYTYTCTHMLTHTLTHYIPALAVSGASWAPWHFTHDQLSGEIPAAAGGSLSVSLRQGTLRQASVGEAEEWVRGGRGIYFSFGQANIIVQALCVYVEAAKQLIISAKGGKKTGGSIYMLCVKQALVRGSGRMPPPPPSRNFGICDNYLWVHLLAIHISASQETFLSDVQRNQATIPSWNHYSHG